MLQRVVVLADECVLPFELAIPAKVLGAATDRRGRPAYDVKVCTVDDDPVASDGGYFVSPTAQVEVVRNADIVVVAPSARHTELRSDSATPSMIDRLAQAPEHARLVSLCIASFVLAAAGELDGRPATTHWMQVQRFKSAFPSVRVDADALYVSTGRVTTSAGAAAGIDMLLNIVREDHGSATANDVARRCVVPSWRNGGQLQYVASPVPAHPTDAVGRTLEWASARLAEPLSLDALAAHANMSRRTFTRKFREATGMTAGDWILRERLERARRLLETTTRTIDEVAHQSGFGSGSSLRKHLHACIGISPSAYRQTFHS